MSITKEAKAAYDREYRAKNKARIAATKRQDVLNNFEREQARVKAWVAANAERSLEIKRAWKARNPTADKDYVAANREHVYAVRKALHERQPHVRARWMSLRRAKVSHATPPWADKAAIKAIYVEARRTGMQVDHIIPLRGEHVSGLHVHTNLQLLDARTNKVKGNRYADEH